MRIQKKCWPEFFQEVLEGRKTFDVRIADFECSPGDTLVLREWDPATGEYTGRSLERKVSYVLKTKGQKCFPEDAVRRFGFQVIAFGQGAGLKSSSGRVSWPRPR
jgi:hypothetical protein